MKVENNTNWSKIINDSVNNNNTVLGAKKEKASVEQSGSIQASQLNLVPQNDSSIKDLLDKKAELDKKSGQLDVQAKLDLIKEKRAKEIEGYQNEINATLETKNTLSKYQEDLNSTYQVEPGSQEALELELRRKFEDFNRGGQMPSPEEFEAYSKLGEPSEYQRRMLEYDKKIVALDERIEETTSKLKHELQEERDAELSREDEKILEMYQAMIQEEKKSIDKQINEKVVDAAGNVVDEKR